MRFIYKAQEKEEKCRIAGFSTTTASFWRLLPSLPSFNLSPVRNQMEDIYRETAAKFETLNFYRCLYNDENDKQWHYLLVLGETCEAAFQLDSYPFGFKARAFVQLWVVIEGLDESNRS